MDLAIVNGTLVTASGRAFADLGIHDGKIVQVGGLLPRADRQVDARGLLVMPGAIDTHTHMDMPFMGTATADDFETGTRAAAAGGVTTIVDFAIQPPNTSLRETLAIWDAKAAGRALIDYSFHVALTRWDANSADEVLECIQDGVPSFKVFMAYKDSLMLDDGGLFRLLQVAGRGGGLVLVHAENGDVIHRLQGQALARGETRPRFHAATRPRAIEGEATFRAITLAHVADCPIYVVHVSCEEAVAAIATARSNGGRVFAESCPQYLGAISVEDYEREGFEGAKFVCSPPLREREQAQKLWSALSSNVLQSVSSDHCPFTMDQKRAGSRDFTLIPNGVPGVETLVPLTWEFGVNRGHITAQRFVELVSTEPARRFGLEGKGDLAVGYDADIMVFDPDKVVTVSSATLHQNVDYTPYEGVVCQGYPTSTIARGDVVWDGAAFHGAPGRGRRVQRSADSG